MPVVVMNVVKAKEGREQEFEEAFLTRERLLHTAEGFLGFELLRRDRDGEYVVLSRWESDEAFRGWVKSDLFKRSHQRDRGLGLAHAGEVRSYEVIDVEVPA